MNVSENEELHRLQKYCKKDSKLVPYDYQGYIASPINPLTNSFLR